MNGSSVTEANTDDVVAAAAVDDGAVGEEADKAADLTEVGGRIAVGAVAWCVVFVCV